MARRIEGAKKCETRTPTGRSRRRGIANKRRGRQGQEEEKEGNHNRELVASVWQTCQKYATDLPRRATLRLCTAKVASIAQI